MKVGLVFSYHVYFSPELGGPVTRWVYEVFDQLDTVSSIQLVVPNDRYDKLYKTEKIQIKTIRTNANWLTKISFLQRWSESLASQEWGRVLINSLKGVNCLFIENRLHYAPILRRLGYKGKIYVHIHNELFRKSSPQYLEKLDKSIDGLLSCCEAVLVPLKESCPSLYEKGQVIYNGVDTQFFYPRTETKKDNVLLFVGRMVEQKGVHLLLDAYRKLLRIYPDLILKLAGSASFGGGRKLTEYEKKIEKEVDAINAHGGTVEMLGFVEHDTELPKLYSEATVFCVSSQYTEAFPMVIVEAMFCGTAVVAPRLGGIPEALPSDELIYPEGKVEEMYKKIEKVLSNKEYREKVEAQNLKYAKQHFTWDLIRDRFEEILTTI